MDKVNFKIGDKIYIESNPLGIPEGLKVVDKLLLDVIDENPLLPRHIYWQSSTQSKGEAVLQWVKAIDRLPEDTSSKLLHIRYYRQNETGNHLCKGVARFFNGTWLMGFDYGEEINNMEWLDESPKGEADVVPASTQSVFEWVKIKKGCPMPPFNKNVLGLSNKGQVAITFTDSSGKLDVFQLEVNEKEKWTHWAYIPPINPAFPIPFTNL